MVDQQSIKPSVIVYDEDKMKIYEKPVYEDDLYKAKPDEIAHVA